ncbi:hypothetical protein V5E97_26495 [Singulisphaera sp. Ch08]|uniref:Response regulator n=1 Tax=Singulisphaera sp. Ch08 TaxID=3120278 RepID=A0AAU7C9T2_9BACT
MPRVLVVEDDPATTSILTYQLASRRVSHITHATTVAAALSMLDLPPGLGHPRHGSVEQLRVDGLGSHS